MELNFGLLTIISGILIFYTLTITIFYNYFEKKPAFSGKKPAHFVPVTVVVPFRNEKEQLPYILEDLVSQRYAGNYEIIFADDNSNDAGDGLVKNAAARHNNIHYIRLTSASGKKAAIDKGIQNAGGELIVTTDADCRVPSGWISTIAAFYEKHTPGMIIGPLIMKGNTVFGKIQALEFSSLIASAAGAAEAGFPIMCNGANLAFEKQLYFQLKQYITWDISSGDDIFLLHAIKHHTQRNIRFIKSVNAAVTVKPVQSFLSFIAQRIRWTSKSKSYSDTDTLLTAYAVLGINAAVLILLGLSFLTTDYLWFLVMLFTIKGIVDYLLLNSFCRVFGQDELMKYFPPAQLLHPFYIVFIVILSLIKPVSWKERKVRSGEKVVS